MLATLVYLADLDAENFCGLCTLTAARSGVNIASAALPRHISLGTPHRVEDMASYLDMARRVAHEIPPLRITLTAAAAKQAQAGDETVCWLGFHYEESPVLEQARETAARHFEQHHLSLPSPDPICGTRNLTLLTGRGCFDAYQAAQRNLSDRFAGQTLAFHQLGVFYYDADVYSGSCPYFCCQRFQLTETV